jgi:sugar/nucleoside kinase (ribokinase family)
MTATAAPELVCAAPAYLDLTFVGLDALPDLGREQFARGLLRSPGGGALNALAAARLGVRTVAAFPLGSDWGGELVRGALRDAGADVVGAPTAETPVTIVMPLGGDRAMVTYEPASSWDWSAIAALKPERVLCPIDQVERVPEGARAFASVGGHYLRHHPGPGLPSGPPIDTLFVSESEALTVTGAARAEEAVQQLAERAGTVVVTLGERGALALAAGEVVATPAIAADPVDTTGAGDLFVGAWIWADVLALDVQARLEWAVLYAALSVTVATAAAGVTGLDQLLAEGERRGLRLAGFDPATRRSAPTSA